MPNEHFTEFQCLDCGDCDACFPGAETLNSKSDQQHTKVDLQRAATKGFKLLPLKMPTLDEDGFSLAHYSEVLDKGYHEVQSDAYGQLRPGKNASNKLCRGIAWGVFARDRFVWLDRETYSLSADLNPEEAGRTREFVQISDRFLSHPTTEGILRKIFAVWEFQETCSTRAYEVQLSAIRYEPSLASPSMPSPIIPHQDLIDGAIVVLDRVGDLVGGVSRIYDLSDNPLYQMDLDVGDTLLVKDALVKHQVTPLMLEPSAVWGNGQRAHRDVLLVRFQPVGR